MTECKSNSYQFQDLKGRKVEGNFNGGRITSDAGALLIKEIGGEILEKFSSCFKDHRKPELIEHEVGALIKQRIYGIIQGYEDLNDHETLRKDPLMATLCDKKDPLGRDRKKEEDKGNPLASDSTLNRLELTAKEVSEDERYKKITYDDKGIEVFFVEEYLKFHKEEPKEIILDFDATDDPIHGNQEGRFYQGYYKCYCYLPLYVFSGDGFPLYAKLRSSNIDASEGTVEALELIVGLVRKKWPNVKIIVRGDSGFTREEIMLWCESHDNVFYVLGLAKNKRLIREIENQLEEAKKISEENTRSVRIYKEFQYKTIKTWSKERRVIAKAEHLVKGTNPRFIVTSLDNDQWEPKALYEDLYCQRGDMENRIKEQQLALFADRTSSTKMRANQLRLWFSTIAYLIMHKFRLVALKGTELAKAQCDTIRNKILKIGAHVRVSIRRVLFSFAEGFPFEDIFTKALSNISNFSSA